MSLDDLLRQAAATYGQAESSDDLRRRYAELEQAYHRRLARLPAHPGLLEDLAVPQEATLPGTAAAGWVQRTRGPSTGSPRGADAPPALVTAGVVCTVAALGVAVGSGDGRAQAALAVIGVVGSAVVCRRLSQRRPVLAFAVMLITMVAWTGKLVPATAHQTTAHQIGRHGRVQPAGAAPAPSPTLAAPAPSSGGAPDSPPCAPGMCREGISAWSSSPSPTLTSPERPCQAARAWPRCPPPGERQVRPGVTCLDCQLRVPPSGGQGQRAYGFSPVPVGHCKRHPRPLRLHVLLAVPPERPARRSARGEPAQDRHRLNGQ